MVLRFYQFKGLLQSTGWLTPAFVGVDDRGIIQYLSDQRPQHATPIEAVNGFALPGFQNAHSHAFQYAMAGLAETHDPGTQDDFWSWREAMYLCALSVNPDQLEAIATMLYAEMLRAGYTHVAEFHYLHHDKDGKPYNNLAELGERLLAAAKTAGIKITLVPVFYKNGGFNTPAQPRQRRFLSNSMDAYFQLLDDSAHAVSNYSNASLGFGVHSLRAVDASDVLMTYQEGPKNIPFHLHAAEQLKEVSDCLQHWKSRPIEWLLNNLPLDDRFHIVHCTHMNEEEVKNLAASGAYAVLCPGTEGNLGDGIFRLTDFANYGGSWSIGTDSHISLNPLEDLRWLDYAQRFTTHKRNTFSNGAETLVTKTIVSGRKAMGNNTLDFFSIGSPFDAVVYHADDPLLMQAGINHVLPAIVYTTDRAAVYGTLVNGQWIVKQHQHRHSELIQNKFRQAVASVILQNR